MLFISFIPRLVIVRYLEIYTPFIYYYYSLFRRVHNIYVCISVAWDSEYRVKNKKNY